MEWTIVVLVVGTRFVLPLTIPYYPIPGVVACLVLDAVDQTIFQQFPAIPLEGYQSYDKGLDIHYLTITYLSTFRNWTNEPAFRVSQLLYYYRLAGVVAFELSGVRFLLFVFPNTFEYFFIFCELVRLRWRTARMSTRLVVVAALVIWGVVKLPQEWWIHIAQLDFTDAIGGQPWVLAPLAMVAAAFLGAVWWALNHKTPPADHAPRVAADPLPPALRGGTLYRLARSRARLFDWNLVEKVFLTSLVMVIFVSILPGLQAGSLQVASSVAVFVVLNTALSHWLARRGRSWDTVATEFATMAVVNLGLAVALEYLGLLVGARSLRLPLLATLFFVFLVTVMLVLFDRYAAVRQARPSTPYCMNVAPLRDAPA